MAEYQSKTDSEIADLVRRLDELREKASKVGMEVGGIAGKFQTIYANLTDIIRDPQNTNSDMANMVSRNVLKVIQHYPDLDQIKPTLQRYEAICKELAEVRKDLEKYGLDRL